MYVYTSTYIIYVYVNVIWFIGFLHIIWGQHSVQIITET